MTSPVCNFLLSKEAFLVFQCCTDGERAMLEIKGVDHNEKTEITPLAYNKKRVRASPIPQAQSPTIRCLFLVSLDVPFVTVAAFRGRYGFPSPGTKNNRSTVSRAAKRSVNSTASCTAPRAMSPTRECIGQQCTVRQYGVCLTPARCTVRNCHRGLRRL